MHLKVGDNALAQHGMMIYEAKVLKIDDGSGVKSNIGDMADPEKNNAKKTCYFVHYQGWAKKWDEWVLEENIYEDTKENRLLQKIEKEKVEELKKLEKNTKKSLKKIGVNGIIETSRYQHHTKNNRHHTTTTKSSPFYNKRFKIDTEKEIEELEEDANQDELPIPMPFQLKKQLVDDWKFVTQEPYQLVPLPRTPNVAQIIKNYLVFQLQKMNTKKEDDQEYKNIESVMQGIQSYFDRALGSLLLYRIERKQYEEYLQKINQDETSFTIPMSEIYGAEHLLRLFVRLPVLLGNTNLLDQERNQIQKQLNDFLKFIQKNQSNFLLTEYKQVTPKYIEQAFKIKTTSIN